jgi:hypothetical protein
MKNLRRFCSNKGQLCRFCRFYPDHKSFAVNRVHDPATLIRYRSADRNFRQWHAGRKTNSGCITGVTKITRAL